MTCTKYTQDPAKRKISPISPNFPFHSLNFSQIIVWKILVCPAASIAGNISQGTA